MSRECDQAAGRRGQRAAHVWWYGCTQEAGGSSGRKVKVRRCHLVATRN